MLTISVAEARALFPEIIADIERQVGHPIPDEESVDIDLVHEQTDAYGITQVARTAGVDPLRDRALLDHLAQTVARSRAQGGRSFALPIVTTSVDTPGNASRGCVLGTLLGAICWVATIALGVAVWRGGYLLPLLIAFASVTAAVLVILLTNRYTRRWWRW